MSVLTQFLFNSICICIFVFNVNDWCLNGCHFSLRSLEHLSMSVWLDISIYLYCIIIGYIFSSIIHVNASQTHLISYFYLAI